ncbi:MAG: response regulator [bacterium]
MSNVHQSPVNLTYRLASLSATLEKLESNPQAENEARRQVTLLRASSEFRGMETLLISARKAEQASSAEFPARLRDLISDIQLEITRTPNAPALVLIVSSDAAYAARLSGSLNTSRYRCIVAESPHKAKDVLSHSSVAFCIVDIVLADMDGREFIADLRTRPETAILPVIAITPSPPENQDYQFFPVPGADGVFKKNTPLKDIANYLTLRLKRSHIKGLQARRDPVTGLPNRAACYEIYRQLQHSLQQNEPVAFVLVGILRYTTVMNECAPADRDELLRLIGVILSSSFRATDVVAHWSASEFAVILTGEDHFGAMKAIEKMFPALNQLSIKSSSGNTIPVTPCIGFTVNTPNTSIEEASVRAESHLYMAFSEAELPSGGKRIISDSLSLTHHKAPIALCLSQAAMAKAIKQILEHETFCVEMFPDTETAFQRMSEVRFCLLIVDDDLPEDSGFHLLQRLNEQPDEGSLRTLMIISRDSSIERVMKLGASDYVIKPPIMPAFLTQIRRVLWHNRSKKQTPGMAIMVVDHELPQLLLVGTTLHQLGACQVLLAKGASDALQRLNNLIPQYLIVSHPLPDMTIEAFIKQIRKNVRLKDVKLIVATRDATFALPDHDATDILGKVSLPFKPMTLIKELQTLIPGLPTATPKRAAVDPSLLEVEIQRVLTLKG